VSAAFPGGSQPDAPEAGTGTSGAGAGVGAAEPAGAGGAAPVGLPDEIVTAALELQRAVQEVRGSDCVWRGLFQQHEPCGLGGRVTQAGGSVVSAEPAKMDGYTVNMPACCGE
jgi:hypothetical protein